MKALETRYKEYRFKSGSLPIPGRKRMARNVDYAGKRFGRAVVIECLGVVNGTGYRWWGCLCDCGVKFAARSRELMNGHTKSCGCLSREILARAGGRNKLPYGHASRNELLASYKKSASSRCLAWGLSNKYFFKLVSSPCIYCGSKPNLVRKPNKGVNGEFIYSGIDRVDNSIGYINGNVVPCCWICNRAKGELSADAFIDWISRMVMHQFTLSLRSRTNIEKEAP